MALRRDMYREMTEHSDVIDDARFSPRDTSADSFEITTRSGLHDVHPYPCCIFQQLLIGMNPSKKLDRNLEIP